MHEVAVFTEFVYSLLSSHFTIRGNCEIFSLGFPKLELETPSDDRFRMTATAILSRSNARVVV